MDVSKTTIYTDDIRMLSLRTSVDSTTESTDIKCNGI
jgi:hypothetical protein